jgi:hypothetical protein
MLSDEAANQMLDFLYEFITTFENHYAYQLRRCHEPARPPQKDLFEELDGESAPF